MQNRISKRMPVAVASVEAAPKLPLTGPPTGGKARRLGPVLAPLLIFAALAGLFAFALQKGDPKKIPSALIGRPAPRIALASIEGLVEGGKALPGIAPLDVARGAPVLVNFWASWCGPCVEEHPMLLRLKQQSGLTILGINYKDQAANARRFLARYGNPFAAAGTDDSGRAAIEWGVYGMPETFVVDGQGIVVFKHVGPLTPEVIETEVLPAIARATAKR